MKTALLLRKPLFPRGTTLLEGVIAIGVIMVGVVGTLVLINSTIRLGRANQDRIVAQDLAREGIELAYAQRNSGSLAKPLFPGESWDKYFSQATPKPDNPNFAPLYASKFNIGDYDSVKKDCMVIDAACTDSSYPDWQYCTTEDDDDIYQDPEYLQCDIQGLVKYLYGGYSKLPPRCDTGDTAQRLSWWDGTGWPPDPQHRNCNFSPEPSYPLADITDLTWLIYELLQSTYPLQTAYPTVSTVATPPVMSWEFFNPPTFNAARGSFTLQDAWDYIPSSATEKTSRIFEKDNVFVQNATVTGATPTKYYRVMTFQPICRGTKDGSELSVVIPNNVILSCYNYLHLSIADGGAGWTDPEARTASAIGVLVTSEVRWPTAAASATHVVYQEYLYDWLNP